MRDANSSPNDSICTPLMATTLFNGTVRDANSTLDGFFGAPLVVARALLRTMREADPSHLGLSCAPPVAATFSLRSMRDANASPNGSVGAPFVAARFFIHSRHYLFTDRQPWKWWGCVSPNLGIIGSWGTPTAVVVRIQRHVTERKKKIVIQKKSETSKRDGVPIDSWFDPKSLI